MSYVLDAGRFGHGIDALAPRYFNHAAVDYNDVIGSGKAKVAFDHVDIRQGRALCRRGCRHRAAPDAGAAAAHGRRACDHRLRDAGAAAAAGAGAHGAARHFGRPAGAVAPLGRVRAARRRARSRNPRACGRAGFNPGSPKQLGDILFGKMGLAGGTKTKTGQWSTGARVLDELAEQGHELPQKILEWRQVTKLKSTYTDALPGYVNPTTKRVHTNYALAATPTGPPVVVRAEPAEHPDPHRGRPQDPPRLRGDAGQQARLGRLFADRAAPARRDRRRAGAAEGVQGRARHPCHDGVGNVRRAGEGHAGRSAPPRQGDQLRHHLRHLGLRARQPAGDPARGSRRLHQEVFRALPRHPRLHGRDQGVRQEERLCAHAVRAQVPLPRHRELESVAARLQRTRRHQCAPAGHAPPTSSAAP